MKILKNAGSAKILAIQPGHLKPQQIMEKAGRTCYQSFKGKIDDETSSKFVRMIIKRGHYSIIEHGWLGFILKKGNYNFYKYFWPFTKFLFITERDEQILISGNMETWRKIYAEGLLKDSNLNILLKDYCPDIFGDIPEVNNPKSIPFNGKEIREIGQLNSKEEILNHVALTVQFNNISRGFTHELVRHRVPVYSQESTRYVDESNLKVVVPPHRAEDERIIKLPGLNYSISISEWFNLNQTAYQSLKKAGWKSEDARQSLPIATKAQIVASCNLLEWDYIFRKRAVKVAHWEIRRVMANLLIHLKKMKEFKGIFGDFVLAKEKWRGTKYFELKS